MDDFTKRDLELLEEIVIHADANNKLKNKLVALGYDEKNVFHHCGHYYRKKYLN